MGAGCNHTGAYIWCRGQTSHHKSEIQSQFCHGPLCATTMGTLWKLTLIMAAVPLSLTHKTNSIQLCLFITESSLIQDTHGPGRTPGTRSGGSACLGKELLSCGSWGGGRARGLLSRKCGNRPSSLRGERGCVKDGRGDTQRKRPCSHWLLFSCLCYSD